MAGQLERRICVERLAVRESSDALNLTGYASTFNQPYDMGWYTEQVDPTAFRETLGRSPDVRLLINHDGLPLARTSSGTLNLDTDSRGLRVQASLDPSDPDVARIASKMRRGDLNEMSFGFRVAKNGDTWSDDMRNRTLHNLDLNDGDVSVVTYPANPGTSAGIRACGFSMEALTSALLAYERRDASPQDLQTLLNRAIGYLASVDAIADAAQADLAARLGITSPDIDDTDTGTDTVDETEPDLNERAGQVADLFRGRSVALERRRAAVL